MSICSFAGILKPREARMVRGKSIWSGRAGRSGASDPEGGGVLSRADVVVYDHLASSRLLDLAPAGGRAVCAGKSIGHCILTQDEINELLIENAERVGPWCGSRAVTRSSSAGGARKRVSSRSGHRLRDRAGGDRGAGRHGIRRHCGHAPRGGFGRRLRDRSRRSRIRPGARPARLVGPGAVPGYARRLHGSNSSCGDLSHARCAWARPATRRPRSSKRAPSLATSPGRHPGDHRPTAVGSGCVPRTSGRRIRRRAAGELEWFERLPLFGQRIVVTRPRDEGGSRGGRPRGTGRGSAAGSDRRGQGRSPTRPRSTRPSIALPATTGWCSPRRTASGSSCDGWNNEAATCAPWAT